MIDKDAKKLKLLLQGRMPVSVDATFDALESIKLIEYCSKGKSKFTHINGKSKEIYYGEIAQNHPYYYKSRGPFYPSHMTIKNVIKVIFDFHSFSFSNFNLFYPDVKIRYKEIPLAPNPTEGEKTTPEKYLASSRNWKNNNKEKCKEDRKKYYDKNKKKEAFNQKNYIAKMRTYILSRFGTKCKQCGFDDVRALQIDHINGGGRKERIELGDSTSNYYRKLRDLPSDELHKTYQLLCANCNMIKVTVNKEIAYGGF